MALPLAYRLLNRCQIEIVLYLINQRMLHIRVLALALQASDGANREPLLHQADRRGRLAPLVDFFRSKLEPSVPLEQPLAAELQRAGAGLTLLVGRVKLIRTELNLSEQIHIYLLIQFDTIRGQR